MVLGWAGTSHAADAGAVAKARGYIEAGKNGQGILNYVHMGSRYGGHRYHDLRNVQDARGNLIAGHFAVVYRFSWEADGLTDVAFICNPTGRIYDIQVTWTNAELNQPFLMANLTIKVLGQALLESMKDRLTAADRAELQRLVGAADTRALLIWAVKMTQP